MAGLPDGEFTRFDTIHECDRRQTDGQIDTARRHMPCYI